MSTNVSASQRKLLQYFEPLFHNVNQIVLKLSALSETIYSEKQEVIVNMSGDYHIISVSLADALFINDKKIIEEILLHTINESFRNMTTKVNNILIDLQFTDLLKNVPKELLPGLGDLRKEIIIKNIKFETVPQLFTSENNLITFTVTGGLIFLSIEISKDFINVQDKKIIEMELLHSINKIFLSIREEYSLLRQEASDNIENNPAKIA